MLTKEQRNKQVDQIIKKGHDTGFLCFGSRDKEAARFATIIEDVNAVIRKDDPAIEVLSYAALMMAVRDKISKKSAFKNKINTFLKALFEEKNIPAVAAFLKKLITDISKSIPVPIVNASTQAISDAVAQIVQHIGSLSEINRSSSMNDGSILNILKPYMSEATVVDCDGVAPRTYTNSGSKVIRHPRSGGANTRKATVESLPPSTPLLSATDYNVESGTDEQKTSAAGTYGAMSQPVMIIENGTTTTSASHTAYLSSIFKAAAVMNDAQSPSGSVDDGVVRLSSTFDNGGIMADRGNNPTDVEGFHWVQTP